MLIVLKIDEILKRYQLCPPEELNIEILENRPVVSSFYIFLNLQSTEILPSETENGEL